MPSPFPGMDPYIEGPELWSDFHNNLASEIQARLNRHIQPRYFARLTPYVTYEVIEVAQVRGVRPDIGVWQTQPPPDPSPAGVATITPAPVESLLPLEIPLTLYRVEIHSTAAQQLVTVIEVLSPVNKRPSHEAFQVYQRKRRDLLRSEVHLLEIDLLRGGERPPSNDPFRPRPIILCSAEPNAAPRQRFGRSNWRIVCPCCPCPWLSPTLTSRWTWVKSWPVSTSGAHMSSRSTIPNRRRPHYPMTKSPGWKRCSTDLHRMDKPWVSSG